MSNLRTIQQDVAGAILQMPEDQVITLLRGKIPEQRLSTVVKQLNESLLDGTPKESQRAREALGRLGFI